MYSVPLEGGLLLARRHVPQPHRLVRPLEASVLPSGLNATENTESVWPLRTNRSLPVFTSHSFTVLSLLPKPASCRPGLMRLKTPPLCAP